MTVKPFVHSPTCEEPDPVNYCECGANRGCRTCGWGAGQIPCACMHADVAIVRDALEAANEDVYGPDGNREAFAALARIEAARRYELCARERET